MSFKSPLPVPVDEPNAFAYAPIAMHGITNIPYEPNSEDFAAVGLRPSVGVKPLLSKMPLEPKLIIPEIVWDIVPATSKPNEHKIGKRYHYASDVIEPDPRPFAPQIHARRSCMPSRAEFVNGRVI